MEHRKFEGEMQGSGEDLLNVAVSIGVKCASVAFGTIPGCPATLQRMQGTMVKLDGYSEIDCVIIGIDLTRVAPAVRDKVDELMDLLKVVGVPGGDR